MVFSTSHQIVVGNVTLAYRAWTPQCEDSLSCELTRSTMNAPSFALAPLILLHGFAQSAASWDALAPALATAMKRSVYALDLVGHGESERPTNPLAYALDAQAEALLTFARTVETDTGNRPAILGYSMGGRIALAALHHNPCAFAAVILEAAGFGPVTQTERSAAVERDAKNADRLRTEGVEAFMDVWEQLPLFATQRMLAPDVRACVRASRLANDAEALARTFEYAGQHVMPASSTTREALAKLHTNGVPLLYLVGEHDAKYRALATLAAKVGAAVRVVPGAGHNTHLESPDVFMHEVTTFLSNEPRE